MAQSMRFGRRLALPSTRQILHELRVFSALEEARRLQVAPLPPLKDDESGLTLPPIINS